MGHSRPKKQTSQATVDLSYLLELADGDDNFVNEVLSMFLKDTPDMLKQLIIYSKVDNHLLLKNTVHKMKSSLRMLGNDTLSEIAQDIENRLSSNANDALVPTLVSGFIAKTNHFLESLAAVLNSRIADADKRE